MSYKKRTGIAKKLANMRKARLRNIGLGVPPDYPLPLPDTRRQVFIFDYDFGLVMYQFELKKTNRINCYDVYVDGALTYENIGWNRFLKQLGRSFTAVKSPYS